MAQNVVIKGHDNPVVINFTFSGDFSANGLNTFTRVVVNVGGETYSTDFTPQNLFIQSNTELRLKIGDTTLLDNGSYNLEIIGYSASYDDGFVLTGSCKRLISPITIC